MKRHALTLLCVLGAALAMATEARAQTPLDDDAEDRLTLPKHRVVIDAFFVLGVSDDFHPFSISPDAWFGVTDKFTVGLVHSSEALTGVMGGTGTTLCITGEDNGCQHVYQSLGLAARYELPKFFPSLVTAFDGGLYFKNFDPVELGLKIAVVGRWRKGKFALEAEPGFYIGFTNRDSEIEGTSLTVNGDHFILPVTGIYNFTPKFAAQLQVGIDIPFEDTGDNWALPLSIGVHYLVTDRFIANFSFSLTRIAGGGDAGAFDNRSLTLGGSYAL